MTENPKSGFSFPNARNASFARTVRGRGANSCERGLTIWPIFTGGGGMEGAAGGGGGVAAATEVPEGAGGAPAPGPAAVLMSSLSGAGPPAIFGSALASAFGSGFNPPSSFLAATSSFFATTSSFLAGASAFGSSFLGGASAATLGAPTSTSPSAFTATISTPNDSIFPSDILACCTSTVA